MTDQPGLVESREPASGRPAGIVLGIGAIIVPVFLAFHPTVHGHDASALAGEMARIATRNAVVHGALIANEGLILLGLLGLADRLGLRRMLVRAGLIAAVIGTLALIGAALTNGFIVPALIAEAAGAGGSVEEQYPVLLLSHLNGAALVQLGVASLAAAVLAWSAELLRRGRLGIGIGALGLICGLLPAVALAAGHGFATLHSFGAFAVLQSIWYLASAVQLVRGRI